MLLLFFRSLRYRWLEYLLAAVIVMLVIATLTVQRSLSSSTEDQIHSLAHKLGKNMLIVPSETDLAEFYSMRYGSVSMPDTYPEKVQSSRVGQHIRSLQSRLYANVATGGTALTLIGERRVMGGRQFGAFPRDQALIGETAARKVGVSRFDDLEINNHSLTVAGVIRNPPEELDVGVYTSLETAQATLDRPGEINAMRLAGCWCRLDVPGLAAEVEQILPGTRAITVAGMMKAQKGTIVEAKKYSLITLTVAILLIGGIMIALMLSQVRRQAREIGLLLATGATPRHIALLFVASAAMAGGVGGLAGYYLGIPLTAKVASALIGLPMSVSENLLGMTLVFSILVSSLAAFPPAAYAARLDPAEVLREK